MENIFAKSNTELNPARRARKALGAAAALALLGGAAGAFADPPVTMAPPIDGGGYQSNDNRAYDNSAYGSTGYDNGSYDGQATNVSDASRDTVFNWQEVPQGQQVPVRRAVFDQGGYQIYDTVGETIVVPFTNHNLYAMKFAVSPDGNTYFENTGDDPVLYVPRGSYLENAAVPGARWYPFSENFHPVTPVFLGIAPSWDDYCAMGWYPHMAFYGGYWGRRPFFEGASLSLFAPTIGLSIFFGGHHYDGWEPYHRFYEGHPAPYHVTVVNNNYYRFGGRPDFNRGQGFRGGHPDYAGRGLGGDHNYGGGHNFGGDRNFGGAHDFARERNSGGIGGRVFQGGGNAVYAHRNLPGDRSFDTDRAAGPVGGHVYGANGGHVFSRSGRTFQGAAPSGGGRAFGGPASDAGRPFGGDRPAFGGGARPTSGETARPAFGGGRPFGGGQPAGGSRPFGGGDHSSGGGHNFSGGDRPSGGGHGQSAQAAPRSGDRAGSGGGRPGTGDRGLDRGGAR